MIAEGLIKQINRWQTGQRLIHYKGRGREPEETSVSHDSPEGFEELPVKSANADQARTFWIALA